MLGTQFPEPSGRVAHHPVLLAVPHLALTALTGDGVSASQESVQPLILAPRARVHQSTRDGDPHGTLGNPAGAFAGVTHSLAPRVLQHRVAGSMALPPAIPADLIGSQKGTSGSPARLAPPEIPPTIRGRHRDASLPVTLITRLPGVTAARGRRGRRDSTYCTSGTRTSPTEFCHGSAERSSRQLPGRTPRTPPITKPPGT